MSYQGELSLNDKKYSLARPVLRQPLDAFIGAQSTSGVRTRGDRLLLDNYSIGDLTGGFGCSRIRKEADRFKFWDSTAETRFPGQITPSILAVDTAEDLLASIATTAVEYGGYLWTLNCAASGGTAMNATYYSAANTWSNVAVRSLGGASTQAAYDIFTDGITLFAAFVDGAAAGPQVWRTTTPTSSPWTQCTLTGDDNNYQDSALMWKDGTTLLLATGDTSASSIKIWKSTDNFVNVTLCGTINSVSGPKGWATYFNRSGEERPILGTAEGLYEVDTATPAVSKLLPLNTHSNNCLRMTVWEGSLYVPLGGSKGGMMKYTWTGSEGVVEQVGLNRGDGTPSTADGDISTMWGVEGRWLFVNTDGRVVALDHNMTWHHMVGDSSGVWFVAVSGLPDSTSRLHFTNGLNLYQCVYPLDNPITNSSIVFTDGSYIDLPYSDHLIAELPKCYLEGVVDASYTGTADIDATYGTDSAARTTTSLGSFTSGDADLSIASGVGVSARNIGVRLTLNRGATTTDHVTLYTVTLNYLVVPSTRYEYYVEVDIAATARSRGTTATEDSIRTELEAVQDTTTQVALVYGTRSSTYVKWMPPTQWSEKVSRETSAYTSPSSSGNVILRLVELL